MNDRGAMIVAWQAETHVYAGDTGYVVIKQVNEMEDDSVILIDPQNVEAIIEAMRAAVPHAVEYRKEWREEGNDEPA